MSGKFINITDEMKQDYLDKNYPFAEQPDLNDIVVCLHCFEKIRVQDFKIYRNNDGDEFISCPNAPKCDGSVIDWMDLKEFEAQS